MKPEGDGGGGNASSLQAVRTYSLRLRETEPRGGAGAVAAAATTTAEAAWMCSAAAPALPLMGSEAAGRLRSVPAGAAIARHPRTGFRT